VFVSTFKTKMGLNPYTNTAEITISEEIIR
jgi:hypothetical protein